jgi:poly-beta-1,6-N-acetyl-D-glucosamine synthase
MNPHRTSTYVVVTPVRDEQDYLPFTFESMRRQTLLPAEWVIVNDGSRDNTGGIIDEYSRKYPWIRAVHRSDRGYRKCGGGIIEAFYAGYEALGCRNWDFMAKLDGDLSFEPEYFEKALAQFEENPRLGIGGGTLYHLEDGVKHLETCPQFHVRGGAKIYRRQCWEAIGGLWVGLGSDTVDEVKANMLGWASMSFPDLLMHHHRFTGTSYGRWGSLVKDGRADYVSGYHPLFLLAKCAARLVRYPYVLGSIAHLYGYLSAYLQRLPRVDDPQLIRYVQGQQLARLSGRETIWR